MPVDRPRASDLASVLPDEGEQIVVIGNPLKLEGSVTDGIVSAVREVPNVARSFRSPRRFRMATVAALSST